MAALLFGASAPASKVLLEQVGPVTLAGFLYLGAALAMLPGVVRGRRPERARWVADLPKLGAAVFFGGILGPVLLLMGLARAPAASVSLWLGLESVATAVLAGLCFRENLAPKVWAAAGLVALATGLIAAPQGASVSVGAVLVGLACACWGLDNNLVAQIDQITPTQTTFAKGICGATVNLALGLALEPHHEPVWGSLLAVALGAISYGCSILLYIAGAQQLGAARSQLLFATAPAWGVALSLLLLGERLVFIQGIGGALMAIALWLLAAERHEHVHVHEALTHVHWHRHDDGHHDHGHAARPRWPWHNHEHVHDALSHEHPHRPDLHHRHG